MELFYNDPKRWSYTFQSYALLSRMRLQREPFGPTCQARLSERSIHSDRYVIRLRYYRYVMTYPIDMIQSRDIMSFLYSKHEKAYYVIEPPYYVIYLIRKIRIFMECFLEKRWKRIVT